MSLNYVKGLRELDAMGDGGEVRRPAVKRTTEDVQRAEAEVRATERENGRYGRFMDQQGSWATAWQAPGRRTPLIPPLFVSPWQIARTPSGELMLHPPEGEPLLISPQQWVVRFDGGEPIVADDDEFRTVMIPEAKANRQQQAEVEAIMQSDAMSEPPRVNPVPAGMAPTPMQQTVSVDNFVAQVLLDNSRLRTELAVALQQALRHENEAKKVGEAMLSWQRQAEQLSHRGKWLFGLVCKAMGVDPDHHIIEDSDIEYFLSDAHKAVLEEAERAEQMLNEVWVKKDAPPVNGAPGPDPEAAQVEQPKPARLSTAPRRSEQKKG